MEYCHYSTAAKKCQRQSAPGIDLFRRIQYMLNENPVPHSRIIHQHMGHGADQFAVLDDGAAAHADVK